MKADGKENRVDETKQTLKGKEKKRKKSTKNTKTKQQEKEQDEEYIEDADEPCASEKCDIDTMPRESRDIE